MYPQPADPQLISRWMNGHRTVAAAGAATLAAAPATRRPITGHPGYRVSRTVYLAGRGERAHDHRA
jgi:hypothetical protein